MGIHTHGRFYGRQTDTHLLNHSKSKYRLPRQKSTQSKLKLRLLTTATPRKPTSRHAFRAREATPRVFHLMSALIHRI
jgi:hypothetical protein